MAKKPAKKRGVTVGEAEKLREKWLDGIAEKHDLVQPELCSLIGVELVGRMTISQPSEWGELEEAMEVIQRYGSVEITRYEHLAPEERS